MDDVDFVGDEVDHVKKKASVKWDEGFLKKHLKLFLYLTFDLEFGKATNASSRIALLRKHIYELKVIVPEIELNEFIQNNNVCYDYCKQVRETCNGESAWKGKRKCLVFCILRF